MASPERLSALRERNKYLLMQLRHQTKSLLTITGSKGSLENDSKRTVQNNTTKKPGQNKEKSPHTENMVTLIDGDLGTARSALSKPTVQFKERDDTETQTTAPLRTEGFLQDQGKGRPATLVRSLDIRRPYTSPIYYNQENEQREVGKFTFQSSGLEQTSASDRQRLQPLLGYDWIAGIVDAENSLTEHSEQFFSDLRTFRQVNRDECVHSQQAGLSEEDLSPPPLSIEKEDQQHTMDTHQCTFCYRINSRLFPTPLDSQESCPVCKKPKYKIPHTAAEPAFIRVSIPRSTLLPAYKYKAHRRCSFDPSDSLGLPSHCLSGWSNTVPSTGPQLSSLDLRSSVDTKAASCGVLSAQPQSKKFLDFSVSRVSGSQRSDQLLDVSRLARYRFQRLPANSKPHSPSYPVF
ncbi:migration and invasion-inhibitory protein isoform X2 [Oncorhynchus mykiss]|uniref:migration and invasion-inhibitory protein isoform X2 n=1 Tax=Oncorhynchus mykiss TaxID=8022 RepID=UPI001878F7AC|nr:migration and invasion-inhibitory protein isoform X2 [Oncorhynchus mykiss]